MYKTSGNIINLYIFAINENHMMYGSWDMEHDRHDFCYISFMLQDYIYISFVVL